MKLLYGLEGLKNSRLGKPITTVGIFDGLHLGHQAVLRRVLRRAKETKRSSLVITFQPHPLKVLEPKRRLSLLMSLEHRIKLMAQFGLDACMVLKFSKRMLKMEAKDFVKDILAKGIGISEIFVGNNFSFGRGGSGDVHLLKGLAKAYGIKVNLVKPVKVGNRQISSTRIRQLIERGKLFQAARLLGRNVSVLGRVVKGSGRARLLGFPTVNIRPHQEAIPPKGVYAVKINLEKGEYWGISNIGIRPTFLSRSKNRKISPTIEVHIFNFRRNIYGKDLEVFFLKKIRNEKKFSNQAELIRRIRLDEKKARKIRLRVWGYSR